MRRENRLLFAAQKLGRFYRDTTKHLIFGIDQPPFAVDFVCFGGKRLHRRLKKGHGSYWPRGAVSTGGQEKSHWSFRARRLNSLSRCRLLLPKNPRSVHGSSKIFLNGISRSCVRLSWWIQARCAARTTFCRSS